MLVVCGLVLRCVVCSCWCYMLLGVVVGVHLLLLAADCYCCLVICVRWRCCVFEACDMWFAVLVLLLCNAGVDCRCLCVFWLSGMFVVCWALFKHGVALLLIVVCCCDLKFLMFVDCRRLRCVVVAVV